MSVVRLPSSVQYLVGILMLEHWTEINPVTLQKHIETIQQGMHVVIIAKSVPMKNVCSFFGGNNFWPGSVLHT